MPISTDKKWLKGRKKFMTGFCNDFGKPGQHEGQRPKSGGKPLPTCEEWQTCPCDCHQRIDQMFEMTQRERLLVPNPEYIPDRGDFKPPLTEEPVSGVVAVPSGDPDASGDVEHPVAARTGAVQPPLAERRTDTGRAARGGLEAQVWEACHALDDDPLTPKIIGAWLADKYHIPTPSSGAINAVWDRWEKMGFAKQAKKPVRFVEFTGTGTWEELQRIKASRKTQKRVTATRERLTIRQPEKRKR